MTVSCRRTDIVPEPATADVVLGLRFIKQAEGAITPYSLAQNGANDNTISDLNLFIFDASGNLLNQGYYTSVGAGVNINTSSGQRNICAVANMGSQINGVTNLTGLLAAVASAPTSGQMVNSSNNFVMSKQTGIITIDVASTPGGMVSIAPLILERLSAKVTIVFDKSALAAGVNIQPLKVTLRQVPNVSILFGDNIPTVATQILSRGDSIASASEIISTSHASAIPLYLYANMQGTNGTNTAQSLKTPAAGKATLCSFIEVEAAYSSPSYVGTARYRYYLGTDVLTNFNVIRNTWYQLTINFRDHGAIDENTWRVDVTGLSSVFLPPTINIPWYSGRNEIFNYHSTALTTTIPTLSSSNISGMITDSLVRVFTRTDNTSGSALNLGSVTLGSTSYTINQRAKGTLELFVDVSALRFPTNATFGTKNYPITQYIQIYHQSNDIGTWRVRPSADWIYVGDGATYSSFTATGTASPNSNSGMINLSAGSLTGGSTMSSVAVRCAANTTAQPRYGYVVFFSPTNVELSRVFIIQNPSTYPISPVGLSYVAGGVFRPGAFNASGAVATPTALSSSTASVWVRVNPFYIATTECTIQQYCDFMNDLGITNITQLTTLNTILDKLGILADYPAIQVLAITTPLTTGAAAPTYSGGKWTPGNAPVKINATALLTVTAPIPNYPLQRVDFFAAFDYGYWMQKYSNIGSVARLSSFVIPTEMQWEAASRGINNGLTTKAAFDGSGSTSKNGTFPYAFANNTFNASFTGNETGSQPTLNAIAWLSGGNWHLTTGGTDVGIHPSGNLMFNTIGANDMAGNVSEWTLDTYNQSDNLSFAQNTLVSNPTSQAILASGRVVRGGAMSSAAGRCTNVFRGGFAATYLGIDVGFRGSITPN